MTGKEIIALWKMCDSRDTCEGCPEWRSDDFCDVDRYCDPHTLIPKLEALLAENAELQEKVELLVENGCTMRQEIQKLIFERSGLELEIGRLEVENEHLREVTKMMPQWVNVAERLPELSENERYCVKHYGFLYAPEYIVKIAYSERPTTLLFDGKEWFDVEGCTYTVTHWQYLPEPPSTEGSPTGQKG